MTAGSSLASISRQALADNDEDRYIIYRVGSGSFASPLLSIKEIVDPLPYCFVPNFHDYFLGLANLRGQVIGVIDLGLRFRMPSVLAAGSGVLLIFEEDGATLGALVSRVESAISLPPEAVIPDQIADSVVPKEAYLGVLRVAEQILPLVSLTRLMNEQAADFTALGRSA